jgi:hypothetical protein
MKLNVLVLICKSSFDTPSVVWIKKPFIGTLGTRFL